MNISQLRVNDIIAVHYPETKANDEFRDYAIVTAQDAGSRQVTLKIFGQDSELILPWDKKDICDQIEDVALDRQWLEKLQFEEQTGHLYMLPLEETWWELRLCQNGYSCEIRVKREPNEWVHIVRKDSAMFGCRFESLSTVRSLQNCIRNVYGIELPQSIYEALS